MSTRISTSGTIVDYPTLTTASNPQGIATGPDGKLWYCEPAVNKIGNVTTSGVRQEFAITTASAGCDRVFRYEADVWYTQTNIQKFGRSTKTGTQLINLDSFDARAGTTGLDGKVWAINGGAIGYVRYQGRSASPG